MTIYRFGLLACVCAALSSAGAASAQDAVGKATDAEGIGQGIGEAASGGQSVFVTATGREVLSEAVDTYVTNIEGRSASAVDAVKMREDRLATAQALAQKFGIAIEPGLRTIEGDTVMPPAHTADAHPVRGARSALPQATAAEAGRVFVARSSVSFKALDTAQVPAFLDALTAAGMDADVRLRLSAMNTAETVDDAVWDRASQKAVASALHEAQVLAKAAGREVGDAEQIMVLSKSMQGNGAIVTLSVRYMLR